MLSVPRAGHVATECPEREIRGAFPVLRTYRGPSFRFPLHLQFQRDTNLYMVKDNMREKYFSYK